MNLAGKNILVTGGGGFGVGEGICRVLLSNGATVIINERDGTNAAMAGKKFPEALTIVADVSKPSEVEAMFQQLSKKVRVLHGLVNNAGVGLNKPAHEATEQEFGELYDVDMKGVWLMSKFFVNQLLKNGSKGNIVNISSVHAHATISGYALYASAKSAVEGFTRGMAVELGKYDIRVNAVAPGYVHAQQNYALISKFTDDPEQWVEDLISKEQVLHKRIEPDDCGNAVAFLLSDASSCVTGQTLYVDGGNTIKLFGSI
ncbi:SDR family NAD(P)-dependent oxidoreductase [Longitalea luteola]|uniref:SDR family NAD(P)-dependent oxidoreductase n=1 Tax=Longitalea luteola TaxID=2812563 RepID=UPI001A961D0A|nr:SDR family oxidoreductase [Longitalea luteola]